MRSQPAIGHVKDTGTAIGRGIYASRSISPGGIVEISPVILVSGDFDDLPTEIRHIVFNWNVLAKMSGFHAIALGYGSMYNHSNPANLRYDACGNGQFLRFIAVSQITKDTELTVNYNALEGYPTSDKDTWFDRNEIEPIQRITE
ncbi:MAG: SET domain-containing protein-lysine N-methyltransferase [Gammaproteobacteria bacterium]